MDRSGVTLAYVGALRGGHQRVRRRGTHRQDRRCLPGGFCAGRRNADARWSRCDRGRARGRAHGRRHGVRSCRVDGAHLSVGDVLAAGAAGLGGVVVPAAQGVPVSARCSAARLVPAEQARCEQRRDDRPDAQHDPRACRLRAGVAERVAQHVGECARGQGVGDCPDRRREAWRTG